MKHPTLLTLFLLSSLSLSAQQLTAILFNPPTPGGDDGRETVQIEGTPGMSLDGLTFLTIDGDNTAAGVIDRVVDLSSSTLSPNTIGTNGIFLIRDAATSLNPAPDPATNVGVFNFSPDLENGTITFLLVSGWTGNINDDLDADNDGVIDLDPLPWSTVLSAVAAEETGLSNKEYATELGGSVVNLRECIGSGTPNNAGFLFFENGLWHGTIPATGQNGQLLFSNTINYTEENPEGDCTDVSSIYAGGVIQLGVGESFLPVSWAYFEGRRNVRSVHLNWGTSEEEEHDYFQVERSSDGRHFEAIGQVNSTGGQRSSGQDYAFIDQSAPAQLLYYRLRQVDLDGSYAFSRLVRIAASIKEPSWTVYPNPSSGLVQIEGLTAEQEATISIFDPLGREVFQLRSDSGDLIAFNLQTPAISLDPGQYLLVIQQGENLLQRQLFILP